MEFLAAFGGTWFAFFTLAILVFGVVCAERDNFVLASATLLIGLVVAELAFAIPVWATIVAQPLAILLFVALYVAAGALYTALWRWPDWINSRAERIKGSFDDWNRNGTDKGHGGSFEEFSNSYAYGAYTAAENKERLSTWVMMWPWSLFWVLANRPARWIWNQSYRVLGQLFDKVGRAQARRSVERLNK